MITANTLLLLFLLTNSVYSEKFCSNSLKKLDILPGRGWDSLRNVEMSQVTAINYNDCITTGDGKYLLPDNLFVEPVRNSAVNLHSEIIDNWCDYSSATSASFAVNGDVGFSKLLEISGSFSSDYQHTKKLQVQDKSITTRATARYTLYKVGVQAPVVSLNPQLKSSLYNAIDALRSKNNEKAHLILELIVRDYGTHFITRLDAGAIIMKEDFILRKFADNYKQNKSSLATAASVSFFKILKSSHRTPKSAGNRTKPVAASITSLPSFNVDASFKGNETSTTVDGYEKSITSSSVKTIGGSWFTPNSSLDEWVTTVSNNLASIDKSGDPLHFLITPEAFPDVPMNILWTLRNKFLLVITDYYEYNVHKGCMDVDSPNFDYGANVVGLCEKSFNNFTFGGVYQICSLYQTDDRHFVGDLCSKNNMTIRNTVTGDFSCPPPYRVTILAVGSQEFANRKCVRNCWTIFGIELYCNLCSREQTVNSKIVYTAYWCAAQHVDTPNKGVMFGGLFTSNTVNPVTHAQTCPPTFTDFKLLQDLHVCVGSDYESGIQFNIGFGGFFSCQSGNPLCESFDHMNVTSRQKITVEATKGCPHGYTQHVASIENDCLTHYCVLADSLKVFGEMPIVLPPFRNYTNDIFAESKVNAATFTNENSTTLLHHQYYVVLALGGLAFAVLVLCIYIALLWCYF